MRRREFLASLGAVTSAWSLAAPAQEPGRTFRIGMAEPVSAELNAAYLTMTGVAALGMVGVVLMIAVQ